jgi:hypothetical protein
MIVFIFLNILNFFPFKLRLPNGATITAVILSMNKTQLTQFQGDKMAGVLIIRNISKNVWHQPSAHATILVGYLHVAKLDCYDKSRQSLWGYCLFHHCMQMIFESLVKALKDGVEMVCTDGWIQLAFVILAAYVAEFPEQCFVGCCMENHCPRCTVDLNSQGGPLALLFCDKMKTLEILTKHHQGWNPPQFENDGLRAVYRPFWAELPHIFQSLLTFEKAKTALPNPL